MVHVRSDCPGVSRAHNQVQVAVTIDVGGGYAPGIVERSIRTALRKCPIAVAKKDEDSAAAQIVQGQVHLAVVVEIAEHRNSCERLAVHRERYRNRRARRKGSIAFTQKDLSIFADDVLVAVTIDICRRHRADAGRRGGAEGSYRRAKGAISVARQHGQAASVDSAGRHDVQFAVVVHIVDYQRAYG